MSVEQLFLGNSRVGRSGAELPNPAKRMSLL